MADFATIQKRVLRQVENKFDLPEALLVELPSVVNEQIRRAIDMHPWRCTQTVHSVITTVATRTLGVLPTNWRSRSWRPYYVHFSGAVTHIQWALSHEDVTQMFSDMPDDKGAPQYVFDRSAAGDLAVYPFPDGESDYGDGEYRIGIPYTKYLAALVNATDTNWFTDNAENFLVYASVGELLARLQQGEAVAWMLTEDPTRAPRSQADREFRRILRIDKLSQIATNPTITPRRDVYGRSSQTRGSWQ